MSTSYVHKIQTFSHQHGKNYLCNIKFIKWHSQTIFVDVLKYLLKLNLLNCEHNAMEERPELKSMVNKHGNKKFERYY
jgi:hypothetical protein